MQGDVIRQVKVAEERATENIQHARAQSDKILRDARHQAVEVRMEIVEAARHEAKQLYEQGLKAFEPELENLRQQFQDEVAQDSARAKDTFHDVVEFVINKFQEQLGSA